VTFGNSVAPAIRACDADEYLECNTDRLLGMTVESYVWSI